MSKKAKEDEDNQNENNEAGPESEKALELAKNERQELTDKARAFLASPQVRNEDIPAKRRFLAEKGLTDVEIDQLIQELVSTRYPVSIPNAKLSKSLLKHHPFLRGHTHNHHPRIYLIYLQAC